MTPRETDTLRIPALLACERELRLQLLDLALLLEIEDDDAAGRGGAQPVPRGGEDQGIDLVAGLERVQVFRFVKVPEHSGAIFTAGGA